MGKGKGKKGKKAAEPAAAVTQRVDRVTPPMGPVERFTPDRRDSFISKIEDGASRAQAYRLVGISKQAVKAYWELPGRTPEATPEQRDFVERLDAALASGAHRAVVKLHNSEDPRCIVEIVRARDRRYGDLDLRRQKQAVEIETMKVDREIRVEKLREERARADIAEALAVKAREGDGQSVAFGLAAILNEESLSRDARRELVELAIRKQWVIIRRAELAGPAQTEG